MSVHHIFSSVQHVRFTLFTCLHIFVILQFHLDTVADTYTLVIHQQQPHLNETQLHAFHQQYRARLGMENQVLKQRQQAAAQHQQQQQLIGV